MQEKCSLWSAVAFCLVKWREKWAFCQPFSQRHKNENAHFGHLGGPLLILGSHMHLRSRHQMHSVNALVKQSPVLWPFQFFKIPFCVRIFETFLNIAGKVLILVSWSFFLSWRSGKGKGNWGHPYAHLGHLATPLYQYWGLHSNERWKITVVKGFNYLIL